jgi:hypothetical protein
MTIVITKFGGIAPVLDPRSLPDAGAATARNLSLRTGEFSPRKTDATVASSGVSNPLTIYRFARVSGGAFNTNPATGWTVRAGDVNFVKGQIADDTNERTYYTGDAAPKATDLTGTVRTLGVPAASAAPATTRNVVDELTPEEFAEVESKHIALLRDAVLDNLTTTWYGTTSAFGLVARSTANGMEPVASDLVKAFQGTASGSNYQINASADYGWVLDETLKAFWYGASGSSVWLAVPITAYGRARFIASFTNKTKLNQITNPVTGAAMINSAMETNLLGELSVLFDPNKAEIVDARQKLTGTIKQYADLMSNNLQAGQKGAVDTFYAGTAVSTSLTGARQTLANVIANQAATIRQFWLANFGSSPG